MKNKGCQEKQYDVIGKSIILPISCIDLIYDSFSNLCNEKCYEDVVVESYDDLIAKENDELK